MSYQSENQLENAFITKLTDQGYRFVRLEDENAINLNFKKMFEQLNQDKAPFTEIEWKRILTLLFGNTVFECAKLLRDKFSIERENGETIYLKLIDLEKAENNFYQVSNQITLIGKYENRYDVTLFVNGLPLIQIELKRRGANLKKAYNQIERYKKHSYSNLFRFIQMFIISNGVDTKYFSNNDKIGSFGKTFYWTKENHDRLTNLNDFTETFLDKKHIFKMIKDYMVVNDTDKILMVMRPYQIYAVEKLVSRALDTNKNGYFWLTTGAGKTLTSFMAAKQLSQNKRVSKVIFLSDRANLDSQTVIEYNKFEDGSVDTVENTSGLVAQITDRNRKMIVATIQKMDKALKYEKHKKALEVYKDEKVIFIIDECHRSIFGSMYQSIHKHFTKAQFFGFTGTPRFKINMSQDKRTTADIFEECLYTYLIKDAIYDENVLGFKVEYINTITAKSRNDETLVEDIDREETLSADERISLIANHIIISHKNKTFSDKYSGIFTTSSIPTLIKYYEEFKKIDHSFKIAAIYTYEANVDLREGEDHPRETLDKIMEDYNEMFGTNHSSLNYHAYQNDVSAKLKSGQIDLLIVVNQYLTGFDAYKVAVLYVDKWLKYHDLVQAFSRTNRPDDPTKPHGNIVCYRNLKSDTDEALKLFSNTDNIDDILLKSFDYYYDEYKSLLNKLKILTPTPDSVDQLKDETKQKDFVEIFRDMSKYILVMKTFSEFENEMLIMDDQTYEDYKSKYYNLYERSKREATEKTSILDDVDFAIEIIETNRINVSYILNLLNGINQTDPRKKMEDIENIKKELDRSDNVALRKKATLIKNFLDDIVLKLDEKTNVEEAFSEYEDKIKESEVISFAKDKSIDANILQEIISEYEFTSGIAKRTIREKLPKMNFLEANTLIDLIVEFVITHVEKFN